MNSSPATRSFLQAGRYKPGMREIEWYLRCWCNERDHEWVTPKAYLYFWESDMVSVTRARMVHELEIKRSISDLKKDLLKDKHAKGELLNGTPMMTGGVRRGPNYFWFVVMDDILERARTMDLPPYAGLLSFNYAGDGEARTWFIDIEREAKRLHTEPIADANLLKLAEKMHYRYWGEVREKENEKLQRRVKKEYEKKSIIT